MEFDKTNATPWEGRKVALPPPGRGYQGSGDRESMDIGPPEAEYGRAIHCNAADSRTLQCGGAAGGGVRVPQRWWEQPGIDWKLAREQKERAAEAAGHTDATAGKKTTPPPPFPCRLNLK